MKIVIPGTRHSDDIIRRFTATELRIAETDADLENSEEAKEDGEESHEASATRHASDCPQCGAGMEVKGNMERCACGYGQATASGGSQNVKTAAAKEKSVLDYYKKIFPDDYAKDLTSDDCKQPKSKEKVEYGHKPADKLSMRVTAREFLAGEEAGQCEVPDAHPESGASAGSGEEKHPDPKWQKGDSANSVSGPDKSKDHGAGDHPKDAGDVDVKSAASAESESLDLSDGANSVSGPDKSSSHGAGLKTPGEVKSPDVKSADRLLSREVIAKWCPECAEEMARRGIRAIKASVIAKQIAARAEALGFSRK